MKPETVEDRVEHTPGPWKIELPCEDTPNLWITAPTSVGVAKIEICDYGDGKGERLTEEDYANARMIASAPDLLRALEAQEMREAGLNPPWAHGTGHDCMWCADCVERLKQMRRTALSSAQSAGGRS